jgi:hypothetical protein
MPRTLIERGPVHILGVHTSIIVFSTHMSHMSRQLY